jgi:two-component system response regulator (stage 0 sporulation protein F)
MTNKAKILYVDDEEMNVEVFDLTFSPKFNILSATSGIEGLEIIKQNTDIQFVISDMKMPGMNGLEFIHEIKKYSASLPCIILSGYQQTQEIEHAIKDGSILRYLLKPFKKAEIETIIYNSIQPI